MTMLTASNVWQSASDMTRQGKDCALITVAGVFGSAPRGPGTRMLISATGRFCGTIGGGALEWQVLAKAARFLAGPDHLAFHRFALGPELNQCCGGQVTIAMSRITSADRPLMKDLAARERSGPFLLATQRTPGGLMRTVLAPDDPRTITGDAGLVSRSCYVERFGERRQPLVLFGAGHVGRAVVAALKDLPFQITWCDRRPDQFPDPLPQNARQAHTAGALEGAADGAFILIMTHSHTLDYDLTFAALSARRFGFVGLIGSATKRARFLHRLHAAGLGAQITAGLSCPVGITGIASKHPAAIAASITAQLLTRLEVVNNAQKPARTLPGDSLVLRRDKREAIQS